MIWTEVLTGIAGAVGGFAMGVLFVLGTMYILWPDLYEDLRVRVVEEDRDEKT